MLMTRRKGPSSPQSQTNETGSFQEEVEGDLKMKGRIKRQTDRQRGIERERERVTNS